MVVVAELEASLIAHFANPVEQLAVARQSLKRIGSHTGSDDRLAAYSFVVLNGPLPPGYTILHRRNVGVRAAGMRRENLQAALLAQRLEFFRSKAVELTCFVVVISHLHKGVAGFGNLGEILFKRHQIAPYRV